MLLPMDSKYTHVLFTFIAGCITLCILFPLWKRFRQSNVISKFDLQEVLGDRNGVLRLLGTLKGQSCILSFKQSTLSKLFLKELVSMTQLTLNAENGKYKYFSGVNGYLETLQVDLVSPVTSWDIKKHSDDDFEFVRETQELYKSVVHPYWVTESTAAGRLDWLEALLDGTKEQENLIYNHEDFVLHTSPHWRGQTLDDRDPNQLRCLAIVKLKGIMSIRDLRSEHIPMLQSVLSSGKREISKRFDVSEDELAAFVHYHPSFLHFHVHFTRWSQTLSSAVWRAHLLEDLIDGLMQDSLYWQKKSMTITLSKTGDLYAAVKKFV
jgi:m7GpppX diphosphatase